jgi:hypothetical protein
MSVQLKKVVSSDRLKAVWSPTADVSKQSTALTFTDILFGFVIKELFLRFQYWDTESWVVRWQLITGITLVLGSWIGYRRSLARTGYELKFFNLPLLRFGLDQAMLIVYFRIAILTPNEASPQVVATTVTQTTVRALLIIFGMYILWDVGGLLMTLGNKYKKIDNDGNKTTDPFPKNLSGFAITLVFSVLFAVLYIVAENTTIHGQQADYLLLTATVLLLAYRFAKEVRSSWRDMPKPPSREVASAVDPLA